MKITRLILRTALVLTLLLGVTSGCGQKADGQREVRNKEAVLLKTATEAVAVTAQSVPVPASEAAELVNTMRPEAERGDAEAQYFMGVFYVNGAGVKKDHVEALKWFRLAAAQDNKEAITARDMVTKLLTSKQRAEVDKRVQAFTPAKSAGTTRP